MTSGHYSPTADLTAKQRTASPVPLVTFRCDRCGVSKATTGRKRWRRVMWQCRGCK